MGKPTQLTSLLIPTETLAAAKTLIPADGGKTFLLNLAGGFTVTLPAMADVKAGWSVAFKVKTAPTTAYIVAAVTADADTIVGHVVTATAHTTAGDIESTGGDQVNFVANQAVAGDWITLSTDGDVWYVYGSASVPAGLTITG